MYKRTEIKCAVSKLVEEINIMKILTNRWTEENEYIYTQTHMANERQIGSMK